MSDIYLSKLDETMRALSDHLGVSSEVVVVAGHELLWHSKTDYPDPNVVIRAGVGFRRSLYELDVLSQLYLSRLDWEEVEQRFFTDGFYETQRVPGRANPALPALEVKAQLGRMRTKVFAADLEGNHVGIRRFATVVQGAEREFLHLLALAEPAEKACAPIEEYKDALLKARAELSELVLAESAAHRLRPKHHAMPLRGG